MGFRSLCGRSAKQAAAALPRSNLIACTNLRHVNVLAVIGATIVQGVPCVVEEWATWGRLDDLLASHSDVRPLLFKLRA